MKNSLETVLFKYLDFIKRINAKNFYSTFVKLLQQNFYPITKLQELINANRIRSVTKGSG